MTWHNSKYILQMHTLVYAAARSHAMIPPKTFLI